MATLGSFKFFGSKNNDGYKPKISIALRKIDFHMKEMEVLRSKLSERRQKLFEVCVRAMQENNKPKASVYANEHEELRKVIRVVESSELALTQVSLRLQSISDIGDAMLHMDGAFKTIKQIGKTVNGLGPAIDTASQDFNNTFSETMAEMGQVTPGVSFDIRTDSTDELIAQAQAYADAQAERLRSELKISPRIYNEEMQEVDSRAPILATGDESEEGGDDGSLGTMYSAPRDERIDGAVLTYSVAHKGAVDVMHASSALGIPSDEIEHSMLKLIAEGKVRLMKLGENKE